MVIVQIPLTWKHPTVTPEHCSKMLGEIQIQLHCKSPLLPNEHQSFLMFKKFILL